MNVRALRGVCIGVAQHMQPGDVRDIDAATAKYLVSIGAVEQAPDPVPVPVQVQAPAKAGTKEK